MKKKLTATALGTLFLAMSAGPASATVAPNQGDADKVLYVYNYNDLGSCNPAPLTKVEGDFGRTIHVEANKPIYKVTVKSGKDAEVTWVHFGEKWATIELSKDVSNYVVWVCLPAK